MKNFQTYYESNWRKKQSSLKFKYRRYLVKQLEHDC